MEPIADSLPKHSVQYLPISALTLSKLHRCMPSLFLNLSGSSRLSSRDANYGVFLKSKPQSMHGAEKGF